MLLTLDLMMCLYLLSIFVLNLFDSVDKTKYLLQQYAESYLLFKFTFGLMEEYIFLGDFFESLYYSYMSGTYALGFFELRFLSTIRLLERTESPIFYVIVTAAICLIFIIDILNAKLEKSVVATEAVSYTRVHPLFVVAVVQFLMSN
jgi:hypothetical protein